MDVHSGVKGHYRGANAVLLTPLLHLKVFPVPTHPLFFICGFLFCHLNWLHMQSFSFILFHHYTLLQKMENENYFFSF